MAKVTPGKGPTGPISTTPQPAAPVPSAPSVSVAKDPDSFSQAAKGLIGYKSSPFVSGALKIFGGDAVILPANLTDPKDPRNDPKYLRLLAAVLGLDELERHFQILEGQKQTEYLAHKEELREARWAKIEEEKEERRRKKEEGEEEEEEEEEDS